MNVKLDVVKIDAVLKWVRRIAIVLLVFANLFVLIVDLVSLGRYTGVEDALLYISVIFLVFGIITAFVEIGLVLIRCFVAILWNLVRMEILLMILYVALFYAHASHFVY